MSEYSLENVLKTYRESMAQPLMSNPPYVGDQLEKKTEKSKEKQNGQNKQAKRIYFFETSTNFLNRMEERDISEGQVKDIIRNGESKFQNVFKGTMEFVKDGFKVVLDIINKKLITVMKVYEKEAKLYDTVSEVESVIYASSEQKDLKEYQEKVKEKLDFFLKNPSELTAKEVISATKNLSENCS